MRRILSAIFYDWARAPISGTMILFAGVVSLMHMADGNQTVGLLWLIIGNLWLIHRQLYINSQDSANA